MTHNTPLLGYESNSAAAAGSLKQVTTTVSGTKTGLDTNIVAMPVPTSPALGYGSLLATVSTAQVEVKVGASRLASRKTVIIHNDSSSVTAYHGPSGVTTTGSTKGVPIYPGGYMAIAIGDIAVYVIAGSSISMIFQEIA
jgi:hypothetical protein